jgi:hypothetical protein
MRAISAIDVNDFNMLRCSIALIALDPRHVALMRDDIRVTVNARWSSCVRKLNSTVSRGERRSSMGDGPTIANYVRAMSAVGRWRLTVMSAEY